MRMNLSTVSLITAAAAANFTYAEKQQNTVKNVLFIVADDLKTTLSCYGEKLVQTPHLDSLAQNGVVFTRAYCQGVWSAPSRASFMMGRYKANLKDHVSIAEHFKNNGYYTARSGKVYHMRVPGDTVAGTDGHDHPASWIEKYNAKGLEAHTPGKYALLNKNEFKVADDMENRQSTGTRWRMFVSVESLGDGSDQPDYKAADKAIEMIQRNKDKPFFIGLGFVRPHYPMVAPKKYFDMYPLDKIRLPKTIENDLDDIPEKGRAGTLGSKAGIDHYTENQKRMWQAYYATVTFMDDQLGRVLNALDELGLRDETAVVFLSDHGYHLGEHGLWEKYALHEEVSRVPLIISIPGGLKGQSDSIVELVDLYPTLSDLAGLPKPVAVHGKSLVPLLTRDINKKVRDAAYSWNGGNNALRTKDWAYMQYPDGEEELYDMINDPLQFTNLARKPEQKEKLINFRKRMKEKLKSVKDK